MKLTLFCLRPPSENSSTAPASDQSAELPMTLGEFDLLREQLCFDLDTVSFHTLPSNSYVLPPPTPNISDIIEGPVSCLCASPVPLRLVTYWLIKY